ncbi:hypothetical protein F8A10_16855 [Paracoccus kondratievae]|uniref:hypothetical protein n=1 Tax=Paracoccus kondratievae TaxID=135740 RepID=UPI0012662E2C|nr:hypothetical protein [Paracoccus kondratievae]QFQ89072.1 hypothetical protein F8A10_16855 [Paracoccus kondratievae]
MHETTVRDWNDAAIDPGAFPEIDLPEGVVTAILIQTIWGKAQNLFSCFMMEDRTRQRFRLETFRDKDYAPDENGPSLRYAQPGERYRLTIGRSVEGRPTFLKAERIDG